MDLYVQLWPVWLILAVVMVNLGYSFRKFGNEAAAPSVNYCDVIAIATMIVLIIGSIGNVLGCVIVTFTR